MSKLQEEHAREVLRRCYGVIPEKVKKMNGYHHANFEATLQKKEGNDSIKTGNYVMKFCDTTHTSYCGNTELQHAMLQNLRLSGIPAALPMAAVNGGTIVKYLHDDKPHTVQLLSFIDGVSINEADLSESDVQKLSRDVGHLLGSIHQALEALEYDADSAASIYSPFHVQNALTFREKAEYIEDTYLRESVDKFFSAFETSFLPRLSDLRKGFIHGDFSDTNIIVSREGKAWKIAGVIDFEECCYGYLVGDIAISIAYLMMKAALSGADPVAAAKHVLEAYEAIFPLTAHEKRVLFDAVTSRMAVSYSSACYEGHFNQENREFLFCQARAVPVVLRLILDVGRQRVEDTWFA